MPDPDDNPVPSSGAKPASAPAATTPARADRTAPAAPKPKADKQHLDDKLDEALEETFPASDPIELAPDPDAN